jgi:hypothetical protein
MNQVKTFENFINEEDGKETKGEKEPKYIEPTIDKDAERLREFTVNGKNYEGVLSTFKAIAEKQKAMGEREVGVISLPGEENAYEIFLKPNK